MKFMKISAHDSNVFSMYVNLKLCSILHKNCENTFSKKVAISKIFFEETSFARSLEIYVVW